MSLLRQLIVCVVLFLAIPHQPSSASEPDFHPVVLRGSATLSAITNTIETQPRIAYKHRAGRSLQSDFEDGDSETTTAAGAMSPILCVIPTGNTRSHVLAFLSDVQVMADELTVGGQTVVLMDDTIGLDQAASHASSNCPGIPLPDESEAVTALSRYCGFYGLDSGEIRAVLVTSENSHPQDESVVIGIGSEIQSAPLCACDAFPSLSSGAEAQCGECPSDAPGWCMLVDSTPSICAPVGFSVSVSEAAATSCGYPSNIRCSGISCVAFDVEDSAIATTSYSSCGDGYLGEFCSQCDSGFVYSCESCVPCDEYGPMGLGYDGVALVMYLAMATFISIAEVNMLDHFMATMLWLNPLGGLFHMTKICECNAVAKTAARLMTIATLDASTLFAGCQGQSWFASFLKHLLFTLLMVIIVVSGTYLHRGAKLPSRALRVFKSAVCVISLSSYRLITLCFEGLACSTSFGGAALRLAGDTSMICFSGAHLGVVVVAMAAIGGIGVAFPLFWCLRSKRSGTKGTVMASVEGDGTEDMGKSEEMSTERHTTSTERYTNKEEEGGEENVLEVEETVPAKQVRRLQIVCSHFLIAYDHKKSWFHSAFCAYLVLMGSIALVGRLPSTPAMMPLILCAVGNIALCTGVLWLRPHKIPDKIQLSFDVMRGMSLIFIFLADGTICAHTSPSDPFVPERVMVGARDDEWCGLCNPAVAFSALVFIAWCIYRFVDYRRGKDGWKKEQDDTATDGSREELKGSVDSQNGDESPKPLKKRRSIVFADEQPHPFDRVTHLRAGSSYSGNVEQGELAFEAGAVVYLRMKYANGLVLGEIDGQRGLVDPSKGDFEYYSLYAIPTKTIPLSDCGEGQLPLQEGHRVEVVSLLPNGFLGERNGKSGVVEADCVDFTRECVEIKDNELTVTINHEEASAIRNAMQKFVLVAISGHTSNIHTELSYEAGEELVQLSEPQTDSDTSRGPDWVYASNSRGEVGWVSRLQFDITYRTSDDVTSIDASSLSEYVEESWRTIEVDQLSQLLSPIKALEAAALDRRLRIPFFLWKVTIARSSKTVFHGACGRDYVGCYPTEASLQKGENVVVLKVLEPSAPSEASPSRSLVLKSDGRIGWVPTDAYSAKEKRKKKKSKHKTVVVPYSFVATQEGDLSFKEGDVIEVLEKDKPNNRFMGRLNGLEGWVPLVRPDDEERERREETIQSVTSTSMANTIFPSERNTSILNEDGTKMEMMYDFLRPPPGYLRFRRGDRVSVIQKPTKEGSPWIGELRGFRGLFEPIAPDVVTPSLKDHLMSLPWEYKLRLLSRLKEAGRLAAEIPFTRWKVWATLESGVTQRRHYVVAKSRRVAQTPYDLSYYPGDAIVILTTDRKRARFLGALDIGYYGWIPISEFSSSLSSPGVGETFLPPFGYKARHPGELTFSEGTPIKVMDTAQDSSGLVYGQLDDGTCGWIPLTEPSSDSPSSPISPRFTSTSPSSNASGRNSRAKSIFDDLDLNVSQSSQSNTSGFLAGLFAAKLKQSKSESSSPMDKPSIDLFKGFFEADSSQSTPTMPNRSASLSLFGSNPGSNSTSPLSSPRAVRAQSVVPSPPTPRAFAKDTTGQDKPPFAQFLKQKLESVIKLGKAEKADDASKRRPTFDFQVKKLDLASLNSGSSRAEGTAPFPFAVGKVLAGHKAAGSKSAATDLTKPTLLGRSASTRLDSSGSFSNFNSKGAERPKSLLKIDTTSTRKGSLFDLKTDSPSDRKDSITPLPGSSPTKPAVDFNFKPKKLSIAEITGASSPTPQSPKPTSARASFMSTAQT